MDYRNNKGAHITFPGLCWVWLLDDGARQAAKHIYDIDADEAEHIWDELHAMFLR